MENSTASSLQILEENCSDILVKSHPDDLVKELGYGILVLYGYAFLVVAVTFAFYCKYAGSPVLKERSEYVRFELRRINMVYFLLAFFASISVFLPASHEFSVLVLRVIFGIGMVSFRKLTILQLGGEERLLKMDNVKVKLGSLPFCCLAPFSCTRLPLNQRTLFMVAQLIYQVPYSQFAILYITMSLSLSDWHPRALDITMGVLQTVSWLGGIWGLYMLLGMVGNTLESTQWAIRQRLVATLAFVIWIITIVDQLLLYLDVVPCLHPAVLPKLNVVVLAESCLILLLCLILAGYQFVLYNRHSVKIDEDYEQSKLPSGCLESLVDDARDEPNPRAVQSILGFMSETIKSE